MSSSKTFLCPLCAICRKPVRKPIRQCLDGHVMCGDCITTNFLRACPNCSLGITDTRLYELEQLIEERVKKVQCGFDDHGCRDLVPPAHKENHEAECRHRKFLCEGKRFCEWNCDWLGKLADMEKHFKNAHSYQTMDYKGQWSIKVDLTQNFRDVQIVSFYNGAEYFWMKYMVDIGRQQIFWTFQYIGTQRQATEYYYEFEISLGPIKKFKVTEICDNDVMNAELLFKHNKSVALSFAAVKNYLDNEGALTFKYRLMKIKDQNDVLT